MSRFKETEKPFEKFFRFALCVWLAAVVIFVLLIFAGVIKKPGNFSPKHSSPAPAAIVQPVPRNPDMPLRGD